MTAAVRAVGLIKRYGGITAVDGVDLTVAQGEVFGIIGPNGAGKSTLFDLLCGITPPTSGRIELLGRDVAGLDPAVVARAGVGRTFQRTAVFAEATVSENLLFGYSARARHSVAGRMVASPAWRNDRKRFAESAQSVLALTGLTAESARPAGTLAYGVQRRLAVGIALMGDPRILFLDEPAAGMNGRETADFIALVQTVATNRTVLIVEHDMAVIQALCARTLVMVDGKPLVTDAPETVFRHPEVIEAYLGAADDE